MPDGSLKSINKAGCRIALLSPTGRDGGNRHGGITPVMTNLANALVVNGIAVDLLVFQDAPARPRGFLSEVKVHGLGDGSKLFQTLRLIRYLRQVHPDVLLAAGWRANAVACLARRLAAIKIPLWGGVHNTVSAGQIGLSRWRVRLKNQKMRRICQVLDGMIAVSEGVAADFVQTTGATSSRVKVIYNPIVRPELMDLAAAPCQHPWFADGDPPVILAVGRLARQKDFPTLINAFAEVKAKRDCRLVILGEGADRQLLERQICDLGLSTVVDLPGFVENPFAYMQRAAVLALSSAWEGFGNVLVEAMALGIPVVSTDCPHGPREILQNGKLGPLVPVGDVRGLAQALDKTLDRPLASELLRQGVVRFGAENIVDSYLDLFGLTKAWSNEGVLETIDE